MAPGRRGWREACRDRVMLTVYVFAQSEGMVPIDDATYGICSRWCAEAWAAEKASAELRRRDRGEAGGRRRFRERIR